MCTVYVPVTHLRLGNDRSVLRCRSEEGRKRRGHDEWAGPDEPAQVTAGDVVLLFLQHQCVHHVKHVPWHPHGSLLRQEGSALKTQSQRRAAIGQDVEPDTQREKMIG